MFRHTKLVIFIIVIGLLYKYRSKIRQTQIVNLISLNTPKKAIIHPSKCGKTVFQCDFTRRVASALKYYDLINWEDPQNQHKLVNYCNNAYNAGSLLDDYIHIVETHNDQLEDIFHLLLTQYNMKYCDVLKCSLVIRHYRDRRNVPILNTDDEPIDQEFLYYRDLFDQMHCYLYHLYDMGLRVKWDHMNEGKLTEDSVFDAKFASMFILSNFESIPINPPAKLSPAPVGSQQFEIGYA